MIKRFIFIVLFFCAVFSISPARGEVIDKVVVVVNNEVITQREVDVILMPVYEQYKTLYNGMALVKKLEEARQNVMEQLIEEKLILSEAKKANVEIDDKEVEERIEAMKKRAGTKKDFERALLSENLTLKDLRARYKEQIMTRRFVYQKVGSGVSVTPADINDYYSKHQGDFTQPEEVRLRNILIRPKPDLPSAQAAMLARDILKKIRGGADFAELAKTYSSGPAAAEGGLMEFSKKGDLMPEIEKVVSNMKEGEVTGIMQTSLGYHIFKMEERKEKRVLSLSEVRHDIDEMIFNERVKLKLKSWLDGLKKNAYIAFK